MMEREKRAVLMVDSSASMLFFLGMILTRLGYVVSTTKTAEEALRMMDQDTPTLVISELTLPKMNGINLLRRVKEAPRLKMIPVIILTAETDPGLKDTCLRAGCEAYLSKPVEPDVLYRSIQAATESAATISVLRRRSRSALVTARSWEGRSERSMQRPFPKEGSMSGPSIPSRGTHSRP